MITAGSFPLRGAVCSYLLMASVAVSGGPVGATYDQRQDGDLNVATKVENIIVVVALPSKAPSALSSYGEKFTDYLGLAMANRNNIHRLNEDWGSAEAEAEAEAEKGEEHNPPVETSAPSNGYEDEEKIIEDSEIAAAGGSTSRKGDDDDDDDDDDDAAKPARPARSLPASLDDVGDQQGTSLDNELPDGDAVKNPSDKHPYAERNDVIESLGNSGSWKLIGGGIEDCGPERRRNSYGICVFVE